MRGDYSTDFNLAVSGPSARHACVFITQAGVMLRPEAYKPYPPHVILDSLLMAAIAFSRRYHPHWHDAALQLAGRSFLAEAEDNFETATSIADTEDMSGDDYPPFKPQPQRQMQFYVTAVKQIADMDGSQRQIHDICQGMFQAAYHISDAWQPRHTYNFLMSRADVLLEELKRWEDQPYFKSWEELDAAPITNPAQEAKAA